MKLFVSCVVVLAAVLARAAVVELDQQQKTLVYHPTPALDLTLLDLEQDGGVLTLFVNYESATTQAELEQVKNDYAGYQVQVVTAQSVNSYVDFSIPALGFQKSVPVKNGQMGPYINVQFELNRDQVQKLKSMGSRILQEIAFGIPVRVSYTALQKVEEYQDNRICEQMKVQSVRDLLGAFSSLRKPEKIRNSQTFESFKASILNECFELNPVSLSSFKELLDLRLSLKSNPQVVGVYSTKSNINRSFALRPTVQLHLN